MQKVLAVRADGSVSYCSCPPELRGVGRCDHVYHQEENETPEEFINRVKFIMVSSNKDKSVKEISTSLIQDNILSFNKNPEWDKVISPEILSRFLRLGNTCFEGHIETVVETTKYGDEVDHLYIVGKYGDFEFSMDAEDPNHKACDFGCVPHIKEDGTFTMRGVSYRCLPVVSKDKVGYGQGYSSNGVKTVWLYQESGNLGITLPVEGDKCYIFGKEYDKSFIEKVVNENMNSNDIYKELYPDYEEANSIRNKMEDPSYKPTASEKKIIGMSENANKEANRISLLISTLDRKFIEERCPEFGHGEWAKALSERFQPDVVNDLSYRRVYTYQDQVKKEMTDQLRRMGVTLRNSLTDVDKETKKLIPKKDPIPVIMQTKNTENIFTNLRDRSNVQMAETLNPLAAYSQAHKISLVGREGYNKDNCPDRLRMVGDSLKGISDPLDQSSGKGVGLSIFLKNSDVVDGIIRKRESSSEGMYSLSDFVPYRNHNNPNRVSMATSQMRQAMPLIDGEDPRPLGDPVSDKAWSKISGSKMGRNMRVVYLTGEKEWEDSTVLSESAAKKLSAKKSFQFGKDPKFKDGQSVKAGQKIGGKLVKYDGTIRKTESGFSMDVEVPFTPGNKIAGRFGNKCTAAVIIPDDQMPKIWDPETRSYKPAEVIMSPLSIGKRGNIGAIMETQGGSLKSEDVIPVRLPDGRTVRANNGTQFIMRLNQVSQEKNHAHGGELTESREAKARFGEMESILMTTTERRRSVLKYLKNQGTDENARLDSLLKAIGTTVK